MLFSSLCLQVNIVPVIAKADTLTQDECEKFKKQVSHLLLSFPLPFLAITYCMCDKVWKYG